MRIVQWPRGQSTKEFVGIGYQFFEDRVVGLKTNIQSLINDFKGTLQFFLQKMLQSLRRQCCRDPPKALKLLPKLGSQILMASMEIRMQRS